MPCSASAISTEVFEALSCQLEEATGLADTPEGQAAGLAAREGLLQLAATPMVVQVDAALARGGEATSPTPRAARPTATEESTVI